MFIRAAFLGALFLVVGLGGCALRKAPTSKSEADLARNSFHYSEVVTINYEKHGAGPRSLIFVHGFGASLETWRDLVPYLSSTYTLYLLDLKGFGLSSKPNDN